MDAPDTIYHYTTIDGLIGIVTQFEIWASDCRFLSDGTELSYAYDIFWAEVAKMKGLPIERTGYFFPGTTPTEFRVFISCFCEDGDLLSQWRGYGADQGYALGFDAAKLEALELGDLSPVQYGISDPSAFFASELDAANQPSAHQEVAEWHELERLTPRLARVKDPGFAEEREWRLLKQLPDLDMGPEVRFRPSPIGPVPYIAHSFAPDCLREVVLGPGSHLEAREAAVGLLLAYHRLRKVDIRLSDIPFRG
jgi:hypothetical protein